MNKIEIKETMKNSIGQIFGTITLVLFAVYNILLLVQPKLPEIFNCEPLSKSLSFVMFCAIVGVSFIFVIPCIFFINIDKRNMLSAELNRLIKNTSDNLSTNVKNLNDTSDNLSSKIENIPQSGIIQRSDELKSTIAFYKHLNKARNRIQESEDKKVIIRLTNYANTIIEENDAKNYFENEIKFCNDKNSVQVFKIISIHTKKKFKQCKKLVDDAMTFQLTNFHLAYININEFNNDRLPKIIGAQIIEDEVILMDPSFARIDHGSLDRNPIFIKSSIIADMYFNYHEQLWSEIAKYHANPDGYKNYDGYSGYILYDGEGEKPIDSNIWIKINRNMPENEQLGREELEKIGIV